MTVKEAAHDYIRRGWSVFPVGAGKRPLVPWNEFRSRLATKDEVESWDSPALGIACGKLSGLSVIDIDTQAGMELFHKIAPKFVAPTVVTPRGGRHLYCQWNPNYGNNVKALDGIDLRAEGGFVVCPPSMDGNKGWTWDEKHGPDTPIPPLPDGYCAAVYRNVIAHGDKEWNLNLGKMFNEGQRNNDLFHVLYKAAKGGMDEKELSTLARWIGGRIGLSDTETRLAARSALERAARPERNLQSIIREYVDVTDGDFSVTDCIKNLDLVTKRDKDTLRQVFHRLRKQGIVEKSGKKDGVYRRVLRECVPIDWQQAPTEEFGLELPLGLNKLVSIYPHNILLIAGFQNAGKTAMALEIAKLNMKKHRVNYFSSEMGDSELRLRLSKREDVAPEDWKVNFFERSGQFADVIEPNAVNIIDYLEVTDEFWKVGAMLTDIHNRLERGVAVVAMQKVEKGDFGRGGAFTAEKPRLYLSLDRGTVKIVKAKNWKGSENPNGKCKRIKIVGGWKILECSDWGYAQEEKK